MSTYEGGAHDYDPATLRGSVNLSGVIVTLQQFHALQVPTGAAEGPRPADRTRPLIIRSRSHKRMTILKLDTLCLLLVFCFLVFTQSGDDRSFTVRKHLNSCVSHKHIMTAR